MAASQNSEYMEVVLELEKKSVKSLKKESFYNDIKKIATYNKKSTYSISVEGMNELFFWLFENAGSASVVTPASLRKDIKNSAQKIIDSHSGRYIKEEVIDESILKIHDALLNDIHPGYKKKKSVQKKPKIVNAGSKNDPMEDITIKPSKDYNREEIIKLLEDTSLTDKEVALTLSVGIIRVKKNRDILVKLQKK